MSNDDNERRNAWTRTKKPTHPKTSCAGRLRFSRSAYNGCRTIINHAQYPEGVFELTYRKREPCFSEQPEPSQILDALPIKHTDATSFRYENRHPSPGESNEQ
jgi:hypothetical protein